MIPPQLIGAGMQALGGLTSSIATLLTARKQQKLGGQYLAERGLYTASPYAQQNKALAQNLYNAGLPGYGRAEQNIYNSGADAFANAQRGATSGSQMIAAAAGLQGQTDDSLNDLAQREAEYKAQSAGMLMQANQGMTDEYRASFQDRAQATGEKYNIMGAALQNRVGAFNQLGGQLVGLGGQVANLPPRGLNVPPATYTAALPYYRSPVVAPRPMPRTLDAPAMPWNR